MLSKTTKYEKYEGFAHQANPRDSCRALDLFCESSRTDSELLMASLGGNLRNIRFDRHKIRGFLLASPISAAPAENWGLIFCY